MRFGPKAAARDGRVVALVVTFVVLASLLAMGTGARAMDAGAAALGAAGRDGGVDAVIADAALLAADIADVGVAEAGGEVPADGQDAGPKAAVARAPGAKAAADGAREDARSLGSSTDRSMPPSASPLPPATALGTTVVTVSRIPAEAPREDRTAAASVIRPQASLRAVDDLGALLLDVPGVHVARRGSLGSLATLSLRGSNPDEVRIYVDGVPLNQAVGGAVDLSSLPLGDVERVEIYRGSSPLAFGQSALGGVVSITTHTPAATRVSARAGGGSFQTTYGDATASGTIGALRLYAGAHLFRALGDFPYQGPDVPGGFQPGTRQNNDVQQVDGVLRGALSLGATREIRGGFIGLARDQGLAAKQIYRSSARSSSARAVGYLDYASRADLGQQSELRAVLFSSVVRDHFSDPLGQIASIPTDTRDTTKMFGGRASATKRLFDAARGTVMAEARGEGFSPTNALDPAMRAGYPAERRVATVGSEVDVRIDALGVSLIPSARLELSRDVRTGRDPVTGASLAPAPPVEHALPVLRVGLLRPFAAGVTARANVGRYARLPSLLELYGYDRFTLGTPSLRPERGVNADVGLGVERQGRQGKLAATVTAFGSVVQDLITWETYSYATRAQNVARANIFGVESELRAQVGRFSLTTQATLTDARDASDIAAARGHQLAHRPRYRGYARAEWRQPLGGRGFAASAFVDGDGTAGNFASTSIYGALPPRLLIGAGLAVEHTRVGIRLVATAMNLSDSRVADFPNYPLPGRAFFVALAWTQPASVPSSATPMTVIAKE